MLSRTAAISSSRLASVRPAVSNITRGQRRLLSQFVRRPSLIATSAVATNSNSTQLLARQLQRDRTASQRRTMFVQTEATPNPDSLKFLPGLPVHPTGGTAEFLNARSAMKASPLARRLFMIDGVQGIFFGPDFITVSKDPDTPWHLMKPDLYSAIMDHFASGQQVILSGDELDAAGASESENISTRILPDDSEIVQEIKELLEMRVRPSIQEDGGDIEYIGFNEETGVVQLKLRGACRTCSSSVITLKNGIENMLKYYVPAVTSVEQVADQLEQQAQDEFDKMEQQIKTKKIEKLKPRARSN
ncbi:HIRA-interacting protein 5 [Ramicandelaber brevisporus]|nr:HIRA-interacting protein 5 [Ramicandelaber brevisporus]